jgi:pimeloyl-ACP methyl ester carboxylesterase
MVETSNEQRMTARGVTTRGARARRAGMGSVVLAAASVAAVLAQPGLGRSHEVVRHDAVAIEVIREGRGPLVVLLPSLGRDSEEFDPIAAQVAAAGFRVVRPRPRGFGASVGPMDGITLHDFARDVAAAIRHEQAGPAIIVGHAYGHLVARATATDFPDLVRAVVLLGASQKNLNPEHRRWLTIAVDASKPEAERLEYLQLMFFAPRHDPRIWLTGFDPAVLRSQFSASDATPQREYWSAGRVPLLDLQAAEDPSRPRSTANELVQEFGADRVSVDVIPGASHALIVEQPARIAAAIVSFARRQATK